MTNPYSGLPPRAFWRSGVAGADPARMTDIARPAFALAPGQRIATAGSCFAQNLRAPLAAAGLDVIDAEPPPRGLTGEAARRFGYGLFSARYGNVYTVRHLVQLLEEARVGVPDPACLWRRGDRWLDGFRPGVEPEGLGSAAEVLAHRRHHLARVAGLFAAAEVVVFTLGLTEAWVSERSGRVFPVAPGILGDPAEGDRVAYRNAGVSAVLADLGALMDRLRGFSAGVRLILTVSPVPLTATATGRHVLEATVAAKAALRAAAGEFVAGESAADYFPSFEIVTNPAARSRFYAPNLREVTPAGVAAVMAAFLAAHGLEAAVPGPATEDSDQGEEAAETVCEEALSGAFGA